MTRTIAICNQKGGVGKSTTAVNLGSYLALSGKRTLLIDLDPQGNATTACGIDRTKITIDVSSILIHDVVASEAIIQTQIPGLEIIPASSELSAVEPLMVNMDQRELLVRRLFTPLKTDYSFVIFDCPPSLGLLTINALAAADSTIIPVQCEYLALEGLNALMGSIGLIKQRLNPALEVGGIVLTMTDFRATLAREVAKEVKDYFKELVFDTAIPRNVRLAESPSFGKPICLYDPQSTGAMAYRLLTQEVLAKEEAGMPL